MYQQLGEEAGVTQLVNRFYDIMASESFAKPVLDLHPADLSTSRKKLIWFLSGWLGGPSLYLEKIGEPMMRRRHFHVDIGIKERNIWLQCMYQALEEQLGDSLLREQLKSSFLNMANHMRNVPEYKDPLTQTSSPAD